MNKKYFVVYALRQHSKRYAPHAMFTNKEDATQFKRELQGDDLQAVTVLDQTMEQLMEDITDFALGKLADELKADKYTYDPALSPEANHTDKAVRKINQALQELVQSVRLTKVEIELLEACNYRPDGTLLTLQAALTVEKTHND